MVAETFRVRINFNRGLTDGASKAPPSASCKTLAVIVKNIKSSDNKMIKKYLVLIGISISISLLIVATLNYPGGTDEDVSTLGFSWSKNFISNLFKERAVNGSINDARIWAIISM